MLSDLYQSLILDHSAKPRNFGPLPHASHRADGHNPLCGDRIHVALTLDGTRISDIRFEGSGCAIAKASASIMTERVRGRSCAEAFALFTGFRALVMGDGELPTGLGREGDDEGNSAAPQPSAGHAPQADDFADDVEDELTCGKLSAFAGVRSFPMRVKCATLAWHTLQAAIDQAQGPVKTEEQAK